MIGATRQIRVTGVAYLLVQAAPVDSSKRLQNEII